MFTNNIWSYILRSSVITNATYIFDSAVLEKKTQGRATDDTADKTQETPRSSRKQGVKEAQQQCKSQRNRVYMYKDLKKPIEYTLQGLVVRANGYGNKNTFMDLHHTTSTSKEGSPRCKKERAHHDLELLGPRW